MIRIATALALLAAAPALAQQAPTAPSTSRPQISPGPTADPATTNTGTAGILNTTPQPAPPVSPTLTAPPSGAPPDVIVQPK